MIAIPEENIFLLTFALVGIGLIVFCFYIALSSYISAGKTPKLSLSEQYADDIAAGRAVIVRANHAVRNRILVTVCLVGLFIGMIVLMIHGHELSKTCETILGLNPDFLFHLLWVMSGGIYLLAACYQFRENLRANKDGFYPSRHDKPYFQDVLCIKQETPISPFHKTLTNIFMGVIIALIALMLMHSKAGSILEANTGFQQACHASLNVKQAPD